jgi:glycerol-3-phosphate dehydrogenase
LRLRPSRGTHLVFNAAAFGNPTAALTIPIPGELNRFVFAMPEQLGRVYLGLTDEDAPGPIPDVTQPTSDEIKFLLDTVNTALGSALGPSDVIGSYAGLRPLVDTGAGRTADVSREHAVVESPSGVISVIGGKLTEYRYMAQDVLDRAIRLRGLTAGACRTRNLPLVGAPANPGSTARPASGLPASLVARYGAEAPSVIAAATCDLPTDPVADGIDVIRAEFEYAVTHEGALSVDDIVDRRTRIGLVPADRERVVDVAKVFLGTLS